MATRYRHQCPHCNVIRVCRLYSAGRLLDVHQIECPTHGMVDAAYTSMEPFQYKTARQLARKEKSRIPTSRTRPRSRKEATQ